MVVNLLLYLATEHDFANVAGGHLSGCGPGHDHKHKATFFKTTFQWQDSNNAVTADGHNGYQVA